MTAQYQKILGTQAMTARTASIIDELTKASNYDNSHVIDVSTSYGLWDTSATTDGYIKGTIYEATNLILRDTLGCVRLEDLMLVVSAEGAAELMQSQEIVDYMVANAGVAEGDVKAAAAGWGFDLKDGATAKDFFLAIAEAYGWNFSSMEKEKAETALSTLIPEEVYNYPTVGVSTGESAKNISGISMRRQMRSLMLMEISVKTE